MSMLARLATTGGAPPTYIEDVFQTWLYTGNGSTQTITNGVDLAGKGGMVWAKKRSTADNHVLLDTDRGLFSRIFSNTTGAAVTSIKQLDSFNADGFTIASTGTAINESGQTYVSWTFRKQPKFFDVVTYTGNGSGSGQVINHNLASVPGCIIAKRTNSTGDWYVLHRSVGSSGGSNAYGVLNSTAAWVNPGLAWAGAAPTSTQFSVESNLNINGATYVAYLFAHNAGGFGASGTDNVISCGLYAGNAGTNDITLGYEAQWVLIKTISTLSNQVRGGWHIFDMMRGMPTSTTEGALFLDADSAAAETSNTNIRVCPTPTGFQVSGSAEHVNSSSASYIYIAIRRGPMRTPTTGTSVYFPQAYADISLGTNNPTTLGASAGFPVDFFMHSIRAGTTFCANIFDRLRGSNPALLTSATDAESTGEPLNASSNAFDIMSGVKSAYNNRYYFYNSGAGTRDHIGWYFRRAPGFFDVVCYTGTGANRTVNHNLGVVPEMMIVKARSISENWPVYHSAITAQKYIFLNQPGAAITSSVRWNDTSPTSTVFTVGTDTSTNGSGTTYVAYLFATVAGVSKVGSYTGTGTTLQVNCGFTGGARFVLIKRTDAGASDWYVWDSARGIVAGNDPYLLLNSTAAEVTSTDYIDTFSSGFEISSTAPAEINANGGTFIFLAIA